MPHLKFLQHITLITKQECIPEGCVQPAVVAGGDPPGPGTPQSRHPPEQAPPRAGSPLVPDSPRDQAPLPMDRITDACENITLPQLCIPTS